MLIVTPERRNGQLVKKSMENCVHNAVHNYSSYKDLEK